MTLSFEELERKNKEYERKRAEIEEMKEKATAKFEMLIKEHLSPILVEMQPSVNELKLLHDKALRKILSDVPTDEEIIKKLSLSDKRKFKKYAKIVEGYNDKIKQVEDAYSQGLKIKLDSLDAELEKLWNEYKDSVKAYKDLSQIRAIAKDENSLIAALKQFSTNILSEQRNEAYLNKLTLDWKILTQAMQQYNGIGVQQQLVLMQKQMQRQIEDLTLDIQMYSEDSQNYAVGSKERNSFENIVSEISAKLDLCKVFATDFDNIVQRLQNAQQIPSKDVSPSKEAPISRGHSPRVSMTTQLQAEKATQKESKVKSKIAHFEQLIQEQEKALQRQKKGPGPSNK